MITALPQPRDSFYRLSDNLRDEAVLLGVRPAASSEGERDELLLTKLGPKGWGRLHHFRHYYSAGWGDGSGKPLSPRALESFYRFLESAALPQTASLFLTDEGWIELCWEDPAGKAIQVEFRSNEIEYYVEADESEGTIPSEDARELAARFA
ncbi:MAG: hypothetical protein WCE51_08410 [Chthoniobacterales bacterium]